MAEPQCGQAGPSGQRIAANQRSAASSSGNSAQTWASERPVRNHLPGPFCFGSACFRGAFIL